MNAVVEVRGVRPTPKEGRAALRAWPSIRRWATVPMLFFIVVVLATMGLSVNVRSDMMVWIFVLQMAGLYGFLGLTAVAHGKVMAMSRTAPIHASPSIGASTIRGWRSLARTSKAVWAGAAWSWWWRKKTG